MQCVLASKWNYFHRACSYKTLPPNRACSYKTLPPNRGYVNRPVERLSHDATGRVILLKFRHFVLVEMRGKRSAPVLWWLCSVFPNIVVDCIADALFSAKLFTFNYLKL